MTDLVLKRKETTKNFKPAPVARHSMVYRFHTIINKLMNCILFPSSLIKPFLFHLKPIILMCLLTYLFYLYCHIIPVFIIKY